MCLFLLQVHCLVERKCHFSWQVQYLLMSGVPLLVPDAVFGESRSVKCCIFQKKMLVVSAKSNLGCEVGCGLTVSCWDHARIMVGSSSDRPRQ